MQILIPGEKKEKTFDAKSQPAEKGADIKTPRSDWNNIKAVPVRTFVLPRILNGTVSNVGKNQARLGLASILALFKPPPFQLENCMSQSQYIG